MPKTKTKVVPPKKEKEPDEVQKYKRDHNRRVYEAEYFAKYGYYPPSYQTDADDDGIEDE